MNFKLPTFLHDSSAVCRSVNTVVTAICASSANTSFHCEEFSPLVREKKEGGSNMLYIVCAQ